MADKSSTGAVHLTTLDLDVSRIADQLNAIKGNIETTAQEIPRIFRAGMSEGETINLLQSLGISEENMESAKNRLRELSQEVGNFSKIQLTSKDGNLFQAIITSSDAAGKSIREVINLTQELSEASRRITITDDVKARQKQIEAEEKARQKQIEATYREYEAFQEAEAKKNAEIAKGVAQRNAERIKEEETANRISSAEQQRITETAQEQDRLINKLNSLSNSYQNLYAKVSESNLSSGIKDTLFKYIEQFQLKIEQLKTDLSSGFGIPKGTVDQIRTLEANVGKLSSAFGQAQKQAKEFATIEKDIERIVKELQKIENSKFSSKIKKSASDLKKEFNDLYTKIQNGSISVEDAKARFSQLGVSFDELKVNAERATKGISGFLINLADKAKWMLAYQLVTLIRQAFSNLIGTIKNTEDTVIELQRVLNGTISGSAISNELYNIAYEFGQTFENVSEVVVRFAQTGKSWQEVIDATRATMLGLNTAELEVSTATEGLIAVMSQFNIPAEELEGVIDRINITADNFPVTSEKIVAALQRAGGTASAFNMTLEETIASITALAEKTGRSGENIGTALNSLIIFTSKAENMKLFSSLSKDMDEVVQGFQSGSRSIIDVWTQLNKEIKTLSEKQKDALFDSSAFEEFANTFEAEAAEYAGSIQQIYGTAGAYRRNYLTVLLNDIGTVEDALVNMADAEGYSLAENETAMKRLSAQWNQLVIAAKELAVQFGEMGFLDILKGLTQVTTAILKATKSIGGLNSVLISLATAVLNAKIGMLGLETVPKVFASIKTTGVSAFKAITSPITGAIAAVQLFVAEMKAGKTATEAFKNVASTFNLSTIITGIGAVLFVVNLAIQKWNEYRQAQKEAWQESIANGQKAKEEADNLYDLYVAYLNAKNAYDSFGGSQRELSESSTNLINALKAQGIEVEGLTSDYEELNNILKEYLILSLEEKLAKQTEGIVSAKKALDDALDQSNFANLFGPRTKLNAEEIKEYFEIDNKLLKSMREEGEQLGKTMKDIVSDDTYQTVARFELMNGILKEMRDNGLAAGKSMEEIVSDKKYQNISKAIAGFAQYVQSLEDAEHGAKETKKEIENLKNGTVELEDAVNNTEDAVTNLFDGLEGNALEAAQQKISDMASAFDELSGKIDSFQNSYKSLTDIVEEYNKTGDLSVDQLQTLLSMEPEYLALLEEKNGKLYINQEQLDGLVQKNNDYLTQLAAMKIAEYAESQMLNIRQQSTKAMTEEQIKANLATEIFTTDLANAIYAMLTGKGTTQDFTNALSKIEGAADASSAQMKVLTEQVWNAVNAYSGLINVQRYAATNASLDNSAWAQAQRDRDAMSKAGLKSPWLDMSKLKIGNYVPKSTTSKSPKSSGKSAEETALEKEKAAIKEIIRLREDEIYFMEKSGASADEMVAKYKEMQAAVHAQADKYRAMGYAETDDFVREMGKKFWELQEEIEKVLSGIYESSVDAYKNAIEALEHEYDHMSDSLDYTGMAENLKKQIEYQVKIQEAANAEFERLLAKGVDINDEAVQSIVKDWRDACDKIQDLNEQLADSIIDTYEDFISLADSFDVWNKFDFSKVDYLKKELEEINKLYEEGIISLAKYKELLESVGKSYLDTRLEELKKQQDDVEKQYKDIIDGYNTEIAEIKKRKDASDKYYDDLIDNLREVESSNERINAQLDYYAERQKILRNLEQAQARSGVEWREKEIEYQEQLADLDEDWRRTQQDWKITDQIEALEKLKKDAADNFEASIARLEEYIEAAEQESEDAIAAISAEMEDLKEKIYRAITEELATAKQNANELKESMKGIGDNAKPSIDSLSNYLEKTLNGSINAVSDNLVNQLTKAGEVTSKSLANSFSKNFVQPISSQISSIMKDATSDKTISKATNSSISKKSASTAYASSLTDDNSLANQIRREKSALAKSNANIGATNQTVNLFANIAQDGAAGALNSVISKMQDFFTQPFKR